jgi:outer membrane protein assembly factor BamB
MLSSFELPPIAVFPVLVGPLQTLLALLPAILAGLGSMLFAIFRPGGFVRLVRFLWRQKLFLGAVAILIVAWQSMDPIRWLRGTVSPSMPASGHSSNWEMDRGGPLRLGRGPGPNDEDPTVPGTIWSNTRDKTVLSSVAVSGDRVLYSTATDIGPFSPTGRGAIVCVDAHSGREVWRYAPENYRATFSSPVVSGASVICGEGLHQVEDARVTCLDLADGAKRWEFRTSSHVESTAAVVDGRVFIGAGGDGLYCLSVDPDANGQPQVLWHLPADQYADCESSPAVSDGVVYFGLGEGGTAVCAVQADTGALLWKLPTPYPVFAGPTVAHGKLYIATGNGNYVQSASDLLEMKLQLLRDDGATEQEIAAARERLKPVGEVWCIDIATQRVEWKYSTGDAILGAIVHADASPTESSVASIVFGSRDGSVYRVSSSGELLARYDLHEPITSSPALGRRHLYCTSASGRLFCLDRTSLKPVWDSSLGPGVMFSSSPTIAHGHVYIGTAQQGLCCIGRPGKPSVPTWNRGDRGGTLDDTPVAEAPEILWQYPAGDAESWRVISPLMFLDGALFAARANGNQTSLFRLNLTPNASEPEFAWSRSLPGRIDTPLVGSGDRVCAAVVNDDGNAQVVCLSVVDGSENWRSDLGVTLDSEHSSRLSVDACRLYLWSGHGQLRCLDLATGEVAWTKDGSEARIGIGSPAIQDSIGVAIAKDREPFLMTFDAETGTELWRTVLSVQPIGGPIVAENKVQVLTAEGVCIHSIVDGSLLQKQVSQPLRVPISLDPDIHGKPVTPIISLRGQAFVATDRGRILCLGARP